MKKILVLSLGVLLLSACQSPLKWFSNEENPETLTETETVMVEGEIVSNRENKVAPFRLINESQKTLFFLNSEFEDLSRYIDLGTVEVTGTLENLSENSLDLLHVQTVQILEEGSTAPREFLSDEFGFALTIPMDWKASEAPGRLEFSIDGEDEPVVILGKLTLGSPDGKSFSAEMAAGTEISVGGKRALRFIRTTEETDIFLPLEEEIWRFEFRGNEEEKSFFYDLLLSLRFEQSDAATVPAQICGGIAGFACPQGYRCELSGNFPDASGTCVPAVNPPRIEEKPTTPKPPLVAKTDAPIKTEPTLPLTTATEDSKTNTSTDLSQKVIVYLRQNLSHLAPEAAPPGSIWKIASFSFSPESLVAIEYAASEDPTEKRKLLFSYTLENDQVQVKQEAYFFPGEEADWEIESGENLQRNQPQEVFSDQGEKKATISEGYRRYESAALKFSVEYPRNFYYASSGKSILFADQPVSAENVLLRIEIIDGPVSGRVDSELEVSLPRDEISHFRLSAAQADYAENLRHLADSLVSEL